MAIGTYSELQTASANWLKRSDLTARIPELITLAEVRLNRELRTRQGETNASLTATVSARTISLPSTYSEALACWILPTGASQREELRFVDPAALDTTTTSGQPRFWTIEGTDLGFECPCDQAYAITLRHLAKFALSDASPTNSLLTDYPDVYLWTTLAEAGPFLRDTELADMYEAKASRAIAQINAKDARSRAPAKLRTEIAQVTGRCGGYNIYSDR